MFFGTFRRALVNFSLNMMTTGDPSVHAEEQHDLDVSLQPPAKVILFNDEVHTFEEVITQIIKATGCDTAKAEALTWEVHNTGKAMVFEGEITKCVRVSAVLEEIDLATQIEV
jgi:ATP-dependent Clp protease adapter protein ClpS